MSLFPKKSVSKKAKYSPSREKLSEAKQLPEIKIDEIDTLQLPESDVSGRSNWRKLKAIPLLLPFKPLITRTLRITSYNEWEDERRQVEKSADAPQTLTLPVVPTVTRPKPFETRKGKSILRVGGLFIRHDRDGCLHLCNYRLTTLYFHQDESNEKSGTDPSFHSLNDFIFSLESNIKTVKLSQGLVRMDAIVTFKRELNGISHYLCARSGPHNTSSVVLEPIPNGALWRLRAISERLYLLESELFQGQVMAAEKDCLLLKTLSRREWRLFQKGKADESCTVFISILPDRCIKGETTIVD